MTKSPSTTSDCLVPLVASGRSRRIFLLHAIGGTIYFMVPVARHLASVRDVYGIQCHGIDRTQTPDMTIEAMAARYWHAVRLAQPHGPYEVVGYSMGGLIAIEMGRQIVADGESIGLVGTVDTIAPDGSPVDVSSADALHLISRALGVFPYFQGNQAKGQEELLSDFLAHCRRINFSSEILASADLAHLMDLYRINGSAASRYTPSAVEAPVSCLLVCGGEASRSLGRWSQLVVGGLRVEYLNADHFQLMHEAHAAQVAQVLRRWIGESAA